MLTTGETVADYEKRRRTLNTLPSGNTRNVLPAYDPVIISKVTKDHQVDTIIELIHGGHFEKINFKTWIDISLGFGKMQI